VRFRVALLALAPLVTACGSTHTPTSNARIPHAVFAQARPIGHGVRFHPAVSGSPIGPCRTSLGPRFGAHVEVFAANRVVLLAAGIGAERPLRYSAGRISGARCFGALVTIDPTGLVLVRPGPRLTLSALFRSWGESLSPTRVASFSAPPGRRVAVFVDGRSRPGDPRRLPLTRHAEIVLEVGPHVPPHGSYEFPLGS
jgi:hypothetical protein